MLSRVWLAIAIGLPCVTACRATPDLTFGEGDASLASDAAAGPDGDPAIDAHGSLDAAPPGHDAQPGADTASPVDANGPDTSDAETCNVGASPPTGAGCCGSQRCIGAGCNHCPLCGPLNCSASDWCCAQENGGGHFQSEQCSSNPADPSKCPLTEK